MDDDADLRSVLCVIFGDAGWQCLEAECGQRALQLTRQERPCLVVLDVHLPDLSGYEVCRALREEFGSTLPILFISGERTESFDRVGGMLIGADDYVVKPFAPDELLVRARKLVGRSPLTPGVASRLSRRELEVLQLLALGLGHDDIAARLGLSPKTVRTHIERIFLKLGVQNRAQAVAVAYNDNLVELQPRPRAVRADAAS